MKLTLSFLSSCFSRLPKTQHRNISVLRTRRDFKVKFQACFICLKLLSVIKIFLRLESASLMDNFIYKNWNCNGVPIRACHSWHFHGLIGKKFFTNAILIPVLCYYKIGWKRYVDDTIAYVKADAILTKFYLF